MPCPCRKAKTEATHDFGVKLKHNFAEEQQKLDKERKQIAEERKQLEREQQRAVAQQRQLAATDAALKKLQRQVQACSHRLCERTFSVLHNPDTHAHA